MQDAILFSCDNHKTETPVDPHYCHDFHVFWLF